MKSLMIPVIARCAVLSLILGAFPSSARADFTKTIQATPGIPVQAATTWFFASCTQVLGVGSYSVNVAPKFGTLSFSTVSGPIPGCPAGSPSLPAAAAFYTLSNTAVQGTSDFFQLFFLLNGQVAEILDRTVNPVPTDSLTITTTALPDTISGDPYSFQFTSSGGQGPVTWAASGNLPAAFSLSTSGLLSNSGNPPPLADPGTYTIAITATDSFISVSKTFTLNVISEDCSANATVDLSKMFVVVDSTLTPVPGPEPTTRRPALFLNTGTTLLGQPFYPRGINILSLPGLVSFPESGIPTSDIKLVYVQTLNSWDGFSVYRGPDGDFQEWTAIPITSPENDYPGNRGIDYSPPVDPNVLSGFSDSPQVHAPVLDPSGRRLAEMHYSKRFTVYIGCHTSRDEIHFTQMDDATKLFTDPRHYIRTLATVDWGVNYTGNVRFSLPSCFDPLNRFNCFAFDPDSVAGVFAQSPILSSVEPPVTKKAITFYKSF